MAPQYELRPLAASDLDAFVRLQYESFGRSPTRAEFAVLRALTERERVVAMVRGSKLVGACSAYSLEVSVPGASVRSAATSCIAIAVADRGRGLLNRMMQHHFEDIRERKEPLAVLWASDHGLYGRYGYGPAVEQLGLEMRTDGIKFKDAAEESGGGAEIHLDELELAHAYPVVAALYDATRDRCPGMLSRSETWWTKKTLVGATEGGSLERLLVARRDGRAVGYVLFRTSADSAGLAEASTHVLELVTEDVSVRRALWRSLTSLHHFPVLRYPGAPLDEPLKWFIDDPRRLVCNATDSLWIRVMDVPRALESRRYARDGIVRIAVHDALIADNTDGFELAVADGAGQCSRSSQAPDVRLDVRLLGSLYLGRLRATAAARAGLLEGTPKALRLLDNMFATEREAWCPEVF